MQDGDRNGKPERQRLVASLVARKRIGTQLELLAALGAAGCRVTQRVLAEFDRDLA